MDGSTNEPVGTLEGSNSKPVNKPVDGTNPTGTAAGSKSKRRSAKRTTKNGENAQTENILETSPSNGFLSESEINVLLAGLPAADETPIPQTEPLSDLTSASILLTLLDGVVQMAWGEKCAMTKAERKMLQEPLERILARFPQAQIAAVTPFVDPLLLLMGLISWGSRVSRIVAGERSQLPVKNQTVSQPEKLTPQTEVKPVSDRPLPGDMNVPASLGIQMDGNI